jgi:hypothetical protein
MKSLLITGLVALSLFGGMPTHKPVVAGPGQYCYVVEYWDWSYGWWPVKRSYQVCQPM